MRRSLLDYKIDFAQLELMLNARTRSKVRVSCDDLTNRIRLSFVRDTDIGKIDQHADVDRGKMEGYDGGWIDYAAELGRQVERRLDQEYNKQSRLRIKPRVEEIYSPSDDYSSPWIAEDPTWKDEDEGEALSIAKKLKEEVSRRRALDADKAAKKALSEREAEETMRALDALRDEVDSSVDTGQTVGEKFDAIKLAVSDVNANLLAAPSAPEVSQVWAKVHDASGEPVQMISEEVYSFSRMIYHERMGALVVVCSTEAGGDVSLKANELEDILPDLATRIDQEFAAGGLFECFKSASKAAIDLVKGRAQFGKMLSEASYITVTQATAAKDKKKQAVEVGHYAANPMYGTL